MLIHVFINIIIVFLGEASRAECFSDTECDRGSIISELTAPSSNTYIGTCCGGPGLAYQFRGVCYECVGESKSCVCIQYIIYILCIYIHPVYE